MDANTIAADLLNAKARQCLVTSAIPGTHSVTTEAAVVLPAGLVRTQEADLAVNGVTADWWLVQRIVSSSQYSLKQSYKHKKRPASISERGF